MDEYVLMSSLDNPHIAKTYEVLFAISFECQIDVPNSRYFKTSPSTTWSGSSESFCCW